MKRGTQINNKTRARALHFTSRAMTFSLARLILLSVWTLSCDDDSASIRRRQPQELRTADLAAVTATSMKKAEAIGNKH